MKYYLNIGSNLGERRDNLYRAVAALSEWCEQCVMSEVVESEPWGFESDNAFENVGVMVESDEQPLEMLHRLQKLERKLGSRRHRNAQGGYVDRLVDIDIVAIDERVIDTPELQVPHPRMHLRRFVLQPMAELAPEWVHPMLHATAQQLLDRLQASEDTN